MALGTLQDQLTYPDFIRKENRTPAMEAKMQALLDMVGIGYLVSRWEGDADETNYESHLGWDHVVRWEDVLSLGEQQRMGVARMFWHEPKIGILDECASPPPSPLLAGSSLLYNHDCSCCTQYALLLASPHG